MSVKNFSFNSGNRPHAKARPAISPDLARELFAPPHTLGSRDESVYLACDSALEQAGVYDLLAHSFNLGTMPMTQFMGYAALQQISQNGLIRACVTTVADDQTKNWIELYFDNPEDQDPATELDEEEASRQSRDLARIERFVQAARVKEVVHEALELDGYEGGALIFIDTGAQGEELEVPLEIDEHSAEIGPGRPLHFRAVDPINVFPGEYNSNNPLRVDYYRPKFWWVLGQRVHASRLVRLVSNECLLMLKPAYNFLGIPQAQILWDYVEHFLQCRVAAQRLLTKFSLTVFQTDMTEVFNGGMANDVENRVNYMAQNSTNDGIMVIDKDREGVLKLETPLGGVTDIVRQSLEHITVINHTPAVVLLGQSPSGFNATGESDLKNYRNLIDARNEKILRDPLQTLINAAQVHCTGKLDRRLKFKFIPFDKVDVMIEATKQKTNADLLMELMQGNVISPEEVRKIIAADPDGMFTDLDVGDLPEPEDGGAGGEGGMPAMPGAEGGAENPAALPNEGGTPPGPESEPPTGPVAPAAEKPTVKPAKSAADAKVTAPRRRRPSGPPPGEPPWGP